MNQSNHPESTVGKRLAFGIVALVASAAIAILIATDAVNPYPTQKVAYLTCAIIGCIGIIQLAYTISSPKQSSN